MKLFNTQDTLVHFLTTEVPADITSLLHLLYCLPTKRSTKCKGLIHSSTATPRTTYTKRSTKKSSVQHILLSHITECLRQSMLQFKSRQWSAGG